MSDNVFAAPLVFIQQEPFRAFSSVPNALAYIAQRGLLGKVYVENLSLRQTGSGDVTNPVWQQLATTMTTSKVGQWTIDGLRLEAVVRLGTVRAPFYAVKSYRKLSVRNCPYLRTADDV